ncbi:helix-turn-helix transcriptional regulator [Halorubrum sp. N11]|uniref:helix-turn-helix transcriptional regulator n=1 Tax=Halorubrum sp. N11 TaxID=3402276 RepID=UPI003EBE4E1E
MRNAPSRALLVGLVAVALVASGTAPVAGDALSPSASPSLDTEPSAVDLSTVDLSAVDSSVFEQIDEPFEPTTATRIRIELTPDRDAQWTVSVRYALADETDRAAFNAAGDQFLDGEVGPDAAMFEGFAREASRNIDRTMRIEDVDRGVVVHDDPASFDVANDETTAVGELRLTFVWTDFLDEDGENLVLGDALTTPNEGTWLRSLEAGQTIEVATPEGYTVTGTPSTAVAQLSDGDVIIEGAQLFDESDPVVIVYGPAGTIGPPWTMLTAAIVVAAVLIAGSVIGYRRMGDGAASRVDESATDGDIDSNGGGAAERGQRAAAVGASGNPDPVSDGSEADDAEAEGSEGVDPSLLSDEERVERLVEDNGGRMRQADIVIETGWSDAKVSQLLSAMAESGRVEKLRLGRENLISIPDDEDETEEKRDDSGDEDGSAS